MTGLLANPENKDATMGMIVGAAIDHAEAAIAELDRREKEVGDESALR
jgi:hypothetical protein